MRIHHFIRVPAHFEREEMALEDADDADADNLALALRDEARSSTASMDSPWHKPPMSRATRELNRPSSTSFATFLSPRLGSSVRKVP